MRLNHCKRSIVLAGAVIFPCFYQSHASDEKNEIIKGEHFTMEVRSSDMELLEDKKEFAEFLDATYMTMAELTEQYPPMPIRGHANLGAWGTAGMDGIRLDWGVVPDVLKGFNAGKVSFGLLHEMGHIFDARNFPRWYITPHCAGETFANIKLSYTVDRLLTEESRYRIEFGPGGPQTGFDFNNNFYLTAGESYLTASTPWDQMEVDALHAFHLKLIRRFGWDVYKKWFRAYLIIEKDKNGRAPGAPNDPVRIQMVCALLSAFSGENLVPYFQEWRMPVTDENVAELTKKYKLPRVIERVNVEFARDFVEGKIHLDPLSLSIRPYHSSEGRTGFTIFHIFENLPGTVVKYTVDGNEVTSKARSYTGVPVVVPPGTKVKAAMVVPGKNSAALRTEHVIRSENP